MDDYMQYAQGRMRKKLLGAQEALQGGVARVCIGSTSLIAVVNGSGTVIAEQAINARVEQREVVSVGANA
jgi:acetylglutamate/LysW-gamma-L-alpha-aminoadipate kinase